MESPALHLAQEFNRRVSASLGEEVRVILFGSQARGDATDESDVDVLVLLPDTGKQTLDIVLDLAWQVGFEAGRVISVVPATQAELEELSASPFFQAVRREGILV